MPNLGGRTHFEFLPGKNFRPRNMHRGGGITPKPGDPIPHSTVQISCRPLRAATPNDPQTTSPCTPPGRPRLPRSPDSHNTSPTTGGSWHEREPAAITFGRAATIRCMDPNQVKIIELLREVHAITVKEIERLNLRIAELENQTGESRESRLKGRPSRQPKGQPSTARLQSTRPLAQTSAKC